MGLLNIIFLAIVYREKKNIFNNLKGIINCNIIFFK